MADGTITDKGVEEVEDDDNTITLEEFLEEEQRLETDANAVLGPSDDKNCTYSKGYVNRQALYACVTCIPKEQENPKSAGVCLACSYHCHEGHELIELYTKRNFRCDCGNKLFGDKKCSLEPVKDDVNAGNGYNQNFNGVYCTCGRPYPDPDDSVADEMLQCIVCEDWFHTRHLESDVPSGENYAEMICGSCTEKLPFLQFYMGNLVTKVTSTDNQDGVIDAVNGSHTDENKVIEGEKAKKTDTPGINVNGLVSSEKTGENECCLKPQIPIGRNGKGATFWPANFRTLLCPCQSCKILYESLGVAWITDLSDTVQAYEEIGKKESVANNQPDQVLKMLSGMDRFQQMEAILNYNELRDNLVEYLSKFAENKKVVREEDIHEFFSQLKARKRQKLGTPAYSCH